MLIERSMEQSIIQEKRHEERMLLLRNLLQLSLAQVEDTTEGAFDRVDAAHEAEWEAAVAANSAAFRDWFESDSGQSLAEKYLQAYSDEAMESGQGIGALVAAFRSTLAH